MAQRNRIPLQVSPEFWDKLKSLQRKIMMSGKEKSLRDLTHDIANSSAFQELETKLLKNQGLNMDIRVKFDRRLL